MTYLDYDSLTTSLKTFIRARQRRNIAEQAEVNRKYTNDKSYYHGYYAGYLTALFDLNSLVVSGKLDEADRNG